MARTPESELRRGWTTGACAAAATKAAYLALLTGRFPDPVSIQLPGGQRPSFELIEKVLGPKRATAAVAKDAGDDPDVTHGAVIRATVCRGEPGSGVLFVAGQSLQVFYQIPGAMVQLIQAIIVISVAASEFFIRHRVHWVRPSRLGPSPNSSG